MYRITIIPTNSWGYKMDNKWDGIVAMAASGEVDFSVSLNAIRIERLDVIDFVANSIWTIKYVMPSISLVPTEISETVLFVCYC